MENLQSYWSEFKGNLWQKEINVRDFIQNNYTPYTGDEEFLAGATENTKAVWSKLTEMFKVEIEKGVYDAETRYPQAIDTYGPGYISKENESIVGLQTDAPLKRGIYPKGGLRMVENSLTAYGYEIDPITREIFSRYRKTHNEGVFSAYTEDMKAVRKSGIVTGLPDAYGRGR
ncbi:MAG: pyruvate formate lyase family protein, partial [Cetobacterium sp.]